MGRRRLSLATSSKNTGDVSQSCIPPETILGSFRLRPLACRGRGSCDPEFSTELGQSRPERAERRSQLSKVARLAGRRPVPTPPLILGVGAQRASLRNVSGQSALLKGRWRIAPEITGLSAPSVPSRSLRPRVCPAISASPRRLYKDVLRRAVPGGCRRPTWQGPLCPAPPGATPGDRGTPGLRRPPDPR